MENIRTYRIARIIVSCIILISSIMALQTSASSQGFSVKPMQIPIVARPGSTVEQRIDVGSTRPTGNTTVKLYPTVISQNPEGIQYEVEAKDAQRTSEYEKSRSCSTWITLDRQTLVIGPMQSESVVAKFKVPPTARGLYYAGIAAVEEQTGAGQLAINVRWVFLPTVLLTVEGPTARQRISLAKADMQLLPVSKKGPASTGTSLTIENSGETYAKIRGTTTISYWTGDKWRRVTQAEINERGILPGITISPSIDIKRALPAGRYRMNSQLYVDGRPGGKLEQEIDYAGDPSITALAADASIIVDPSEITITASPGSTRSSIVTVTNPSEDALNITCDFLKPLELLNAMAKDANAGIYSCAEWIEATPKSFTLRPGGKQNVRLSVVYPDNVTPLPNYYANLVFNAAYPDGRNAGSFESLMIIDNSKVDKAPNATPVKMNLKQQDDGTYIIIARFANSGNTHYAPKVTASVKAAIGNEITSVSLETSRKLILPLGEPEYSGSIEFSKIPTGTYKIDAVMLYGDAKSCIQTLPIKVEMKDGKAIVTIIGSTPAKAAPPAKPKPAVKAKPAVKKK